MLVFQGAVAAGSATWGGLAARRGIDTALLWAGGAAILSTVLAGFLRLPDTARLDVTPWNPWRAPVVGAEFGLDGPVLVTVEYDVRPERAADFLAAMREFGRIRRRDGASHWGICRDLETPGNAEPPGLPFTLVAPSNTHSPPTGAPRSSPEAPPESHTPSRSPRFPSPRP
jgi:hypothetical protein